MFPASYPCQEKRHIGLYTGTVHTVKYSIQGPQFINTVDTMISVIAQVVCNFVRDVCNYKCNLQFMISEEIVLIFVHNLLYLKRLYMVFVHNL